MHWKPATNLFKSCDLKQNTFKWKKKNITWTECIQKFKASEQVIKWIIVIRLTTAWNDLWRSEKAMNVTSSIQTWAYKICKACHKDDYNKG